jgi:hypothetical protein
MRENVWTFDRTFEFVKAKRPSKNTNPNFGFKAQLRDYEKELCVLKVSG